MGSYGKSDYKIITVTPTLDTSGAYANGDVLFNGLAIPNAVLGNGGCSKLINMYIYNQAGQVIDATFIFSQNSLTLGTQHATASVGDDAMEAAKLTGMVLLDGSASTTASIDNSRLFSSTYNASVQDFIPLLLQAADDSTSVYVSATVDDGTPDFSSAGADALDLILHIQYR